MRNFLAAAVIALSLSGCATTGGFPTPDQINQVIADVQAKTRLACSFVPTAQTVTAIFTAIGVPYIGMVTDVAAQICAAVTRPSAKAGTRPTVKGVVIRGSFVR